MKKIITAILILIAFQSKAQIYTPELSRSFPYLRIDSGFALQVRDTNYTRGVKRPGLLTVRPQDSLLYMYSGKKWQKVAVDSTGLTALINKKVDSVKILTDTLFYYINGVAHGAVFSVSSAYPTSIGFDTTTGVLTINRNGLSAITKNLDGRYSLKGHTHINTDITDFTPAVRNAIAAGSGISYNNVTGIISTTGSGAGTVTSISTGYGLSGGPITTAGTIVADSSVIANKSYVNNLGDLKLNKTDTTNKWVQNVTKNPGGDSFYVWKNGTYTALRDSIGISTIPNLQQVTDVNNLTTNDLYVRSANGYIQVFAPTGLKSAGVFIYNYSGHSSGALQVSNDSAVAVIYSDHLHPYRLADGSGDSTNNRQFQIPNSQGFLTTSVNGNIADSTGNIAISIPTPVYPVTSVFGRTGAVTAQNGDYTTTQVTEGTNLYYTDARARLSISALSPILYNNSTGIISADTTTGSPKLATQYFVKSRPISTFTNDAGYITSASAGETNTASNLAGLGVGIWKDKSGVDLRFKRLKAGPGISVTDNTDSITIANTITNNNQLTNGSGYITSYTETDPIVKAINGIVKSNGTTISAATSGTDYSVGTSALATGILKSTTTSGALSIAVAGDFPTLNQNTTGTASNITGVLNATSFPALTGDVTTPSGSIATTLATVNSNVGTFNNITINAKGLATAGSNIAYITAANLALGTATSSTQPITNSGGTGFTLPVFSTTAGLVPGTTSNTTNFLRADGTFAVPVNSGGTVTTFSSGNLSPLFTTSVANATSTPALSFSLSNAAAHTFLGNNTASSAAPSYSAINEADVTNLTSDLAGKEPTVGFTTLGRNIATQTNPSAITFPRYNADNTVSALTASAFRTAIGAGTGDGTVTSVTGTTNRITSSGGTAPAIDISSSYVGQSSITTLGTITTGVWNGTAVANANLANSTISGISLGSNLANLTATDATLTFSGTYNGSTARTIGLNLGNPNNWTADQTHTANIILSGNQTASAWTTNGLRLRSVAAKLTDNTSTGTVAVAHTYKFSADTIAATNAGVTFTDYNTAKFTAPVAGTNVTITNPWAVFSDNIKVGTSNPVKITTAGILTATNAVLTTPDLGTPSAINLTNATGFPTLNQNTTGTANIAGGTLGAIPYQSAANTTTVLAASSTARKMLLSGASAAPIWSTETIAVPGTSGNILMSDGTNWTSVSNTVPAANITGTTLASNVVTSSLTTIGTLVAGAVPTSLLTGTLAAGQFPALTGDITTSAGSLATTLATVNSNTGTFGSATQTPTFTVNGKGLITAASQQSIAIAESQVTNLVTDLSNKASAVTTVLGISAAGTTQGTATVLVGSPSTQEVTTVASGTGVVMPAPVAGNHVLIVHRGVNPLIIYPASGHTINGLAANAGYTVTANSTTRFIAKSSTAWYAYQNYQNGDLVSTDANNTYTLATVNPNVGTWNTVTVNGKGLVTVGSNTSYLQASNFVIEEVPTGTINGSNVTFTLANTPIAGSVKIFLNGLRLAVSASDYTILGTIITMTTAPATGDVLITDYIK